MARQKAKPAEGAGGRGAGANADDEDTNSERPNLMIWHYKDLRLQSMQQVQENADRNFNYLALYRVQDNKMVRLADEEVPTLTFTGRGRWAIGTSDDAYERQGNLDGRRFQDVYAIDTKTGQKKAIKKELRWGNSPSPDGTKYLYYENQHFHVYDIEAGTVRNITSTVPASFVNREDDHNIVDPPTNVVGWTADNLSVLVSDRWDIWQVPVRRLRFGREPHRQRPQGRNPVPDPRADLSRRARHRSHEAAVLLGDVGVDEAIRLRRARGGEAGAQDAALGGRLVRPSHEGGESRRLDLQPRNPDDADVAVRDGRHARERPEDHRYGEGIGSRSSGPPARS